MEFFIRRDDEFQRLYNCSFYNVSDIPLEKRVNMLIGGSVFVILYVPCMFAMWRHLQFGCYKIMFYMGVLDMLNLIVFCMSDGILSMLGAVYCNAPDFLYMKGSLTMGLWIAESSVEVILALNRCLCFAAPNFAEHLFGSNDLRTEHRVWFWMVPPTLWGLWYFIWGTPAIFSSISHMEIWNPHRGYFDDMIKNYKFEIFDAHQIFIATTLPIIYATFALILFIRAQSASSPSNPNRTYSQKMIFAQVLLIALINFLAASISVAIQLNLVQEMEWLTTVEIFLYMQAHGIPPLIYLSMNKTIRNETHKLILKFLCVNNLGEHSSQQTLAAEFHHVARIQHNFNGDKEMLQLPPLADNLARRQSILPIKHSKIVPKQSILEP